jgi:hypothetical protein
MYAGKWVRGPSMQTSDNTVTTKAATKPLRFWGEQQCDRRLLLMLPVELDARGRKRVSPWTKTKEVKKEGEPKKIYKVIASATEEIRLDDLLTLIATTGCMQDAISNGTAAVNTIAEAGKKELTLISAIFKSSHLCREAAGDKDIASFLATLERLVSYHCTYYAVGGSQGIAKYLYKYLHDAESGEISIILDASVVNYYANYGWILDVKNIRKDISSSPARALVLYLSQQPGQRFNIDNLCKKVSINCSSVKENRRQLKKALDFLKPNENAGYAGHIIDYVIVKDMIEINRIEKYL